MKDCTRKNFAMTAIAHAAIAVMFVSPLAGCGPKAALDKRGAASSPPNESVAERSTQHAPQTSASGAGTPRLAVALTPVDRATFDAEIAKHKGKVVLVDFWATWCKPCVEQLPHTIE